MLAVVLFAFQSAVESEKPPIELVGFRGDADPIAACVSEDGRRIYSAEGASIAILELRDGALVEVGRFAVDATLVQMEARGERLFVAGANRGAGVIELANGPPRVRWFDALENALCTQIGFDEERPVAVFAARGRSELRVYDEELARAANVVVPGLPYDVEVRDRVAYLALGPAGVARVALDAGPELRVEAGPKLPLDGLPPKWVLGAPWARDLALDGDSLHVAADAGGLVEIELGGDWRGAKARAIPLRLDDHPTYAVRIAADRGRVAVGTTRGPCAAADGAPYGLFGRIGWSLEIGAVPPRSYPPGPSEALWIFEHSDERGCVERAKELVEHSAWRTLELRGDRLCEQHMKIGTVVREVVAESDERLAVRTLAARCPPGIPAIDGVASLVDPRLVLFGTDSAGSSARGLLRLGDDGVPAPAPGLDAIDSLGLCVGASWLDAEPNVEWFVSSASFVWRVHRLRHGKEPKLERWDLVPPEAPDAARGGLRGHSYLNSLASGDMLLATRFGSRFGLVAYSLREITEVAGRSETGAKLAVAPRWQAETHLAEESAPCFTWHVRTFTARDGRRIAAVAAGANTRENGAKFERPQVVLLDVTRGLDEAPKRLAVLHGETAKGLAIAVEPFELASRRRLAVATSGGELLIFDVDDPTAAKLERTLLAPPHGYDETPDALLDVELWPNVDGSSVLALVAAGRTGLLSVDLAGAGELTLVDDTPGWAAGLATTTIDGRRHLLLGDQRAGLRVYR
jgi:hypothetical protein